MVRVVELAQHRAGGDAAVDIPGALRGGQLRQELLAPALDVLDHRLGLARLETPRNRQVADVPIVRQVGLGQYHCTCSGVPMLR